MIGYVTLGTSDLARGAQFYDAIAAELGTGRMFVNEQFIAWGTPGGDQQDQWSCQLLLRHIHSGMTMQQAIDAPRSIVAVS